MKNLIIDFFKTQIDKNNDLFLVKKVLRGFFAIKIFLTQ